MTDAELLDELTNDPTGAGYAEHMALGSDGTLAAMLSTEVGGKPSRAAVVSQIDGDTVSAAHVSDVLAPGRVDAAVAAILAGEWPAIAVTIPADRLEAEAITPAHFAAAKAHNEGTCLGLPPELCGDALAMINARDAARAKQLGDALPAEKVQAEAAFVDAIATGVADDFVAEKAREAFALKVNTAVTAKLAAAGNP